MNTADLKEALPGAGLSMTIAVIAYMTSSLHQAFDPLVISIVFGLLVSNMLDDRSMLEKGLSLSIRVALPVGIGLYGLQLDFFVLEGRYWPLAVSVFLLTFAVSYFISRGFGIGKPLAFLISSGMSVCGASAIAVIAPILAVEEEDTSISILSVMTVGLTGMLFYRFMPELMGLSAERFSFISGMTLPMLGQVKVASQWLGQESLELAFNFKLLRISALLPVSAAAMLVRGRSLRGSSVPWFMTAFVLLAVGANTSEWIASLRAGAETLSRLFLSVALSAIGLSLDFDSITDRGASPLFAAFLSWGIVVLTIYLFFSVIS